MVFAAPSKPGISLVSPSPTLCNNYVSSSLSENPSPSSHSQRTIFSIWRKPKAPDENPYSTSHGPSLPFHKEEPFSPNKSQSFPGFRCLLSDSLIVPFLLLLKPLPLLSHSHQHPNNHLQHSLPWPPFERCPLPYFCPQPSLLKRCPHRLFSHFLPLLFISQLAPLKVPGPLSPALLKFTLAKASRHPHPDLSAVSDHSFLLEMRPIPPPPPLASKPHPPFWYSSYLLNLQGCFPTTTGLLNVGAPQD